VLPPEVPGCGATPPIAVLALAGPVDVLGLDSADRLSVLVDGVTAVGAVLDDGVVVFSAPVVSRRWQADSAAAAHSSRMKGVRRMVFDSGAGGGALGWTGASRVPARAADQVDFDTVIVGNFAL
jgi:hypothetical protein